MKVYETSPIFEPNVSSHILDGKIPVNLNSEIKISLSINDVQKILNQNEESAIDFHKWKDLAYQNRLNCIESSFKQSIMKSLECDETFFYDNEFNIFYMDDLDFDVNEVVLKIKDNISKTITVSENRLLELTRSNDKNIEFSGSSIIFNDDHYCITIKDGIELKEAIVNHLDKFFDNTIVFAGNMSPTKNPLPLNEFKKEFEKLISKETIEKTDVVELIKWTCEKSGIKLDAMFSE